MSTLVNHLFKPWLTLFGSIVPETFILNKFGDVSRSISFIIERDVFYCFIEKLEKKKEKNKRDCFLSLENKEMDNKCVLITKSITRDFFCLTFFSSDKFALVDEKRKKEKKEKFVSFKEKFALKCIVIK